MMHKRLAHRYPLLRRGKYRQNLFKYMSRLLMQVNSIRDERFESEAHFASS
jgi:hypothetical protein